MHKRIAGIAAGLAAVVSVGFAQAPIASAVVYLDQGDLTTACRLAKGNSNWTAQLTYPSQGGYGWRCVQTVGGSITGVNIEGFCQYYFSNHARGGSTAYNWYCGA